MGQRLEYLINKAIRKANELRHEYLSLECVLCVLLDDEQVVDALELCGADVEEVRRELELFLEGGHRFSILTDKKIKELSKKQFLDEDVRAMAEKAGINYQPEISMSLQRVIQRAAVHIQSSGKGHIKGVNMLIAMFQEEHSFAVYLLKKQGVERFHLIQNISHGVARSIIIQEEEEDEEGEGGHLKRRKRSSFLEKYSTNLNALAKKKKLDPLIGRERELNRVIQVLCRRRKNNPLLVGEAGVGKTAIAEGLAWAIEEERMTLPHTLKELTVFALDIGALLAGAKFRGDFEERLKGILKEVAEMREEGKESLIFIDELHMAMGAGSTGGGGVDVSNLLKPALNTADFVAWEVRLMRSIENLSKKTSPLAGAFKKLTSMGHPKRIHLKSCKGSALALKNTTM